MSMIPASIPEAQELLLPGKATMTWTSPLTFLTGNAMYALIMIMPSMKIRVAPSIPFFPRMWMRLMSRASTSPRREDL